jgi:hypothetical protein
LTTEKRSAILSARAKNRKAATALAVAEVKVPKAIVAHMKAVEDWANKQLLPYRARRTILTTVTNREPGGDV